MTLRPHNELVGIAWLKGVPGLPAGSIGTTLPSDNSTWSASGFIQVGIAGGSPEPYLPIHRPVLQLDFWAVNSSGSRPPWGKANQLAEVVKANCYDHQDAATPTLRTVTLHVAGYQQARVLSAQMMTEPRRMPDDEARYARYSADLALVWTVIP